MSNVNLSIGGRGFIVSCADSEKDHVAQLGRMIDEKVTAAGLAGQPEGRMLLFAMLLLADELHNAGAPAFQSDELRVKLDAVATKIENLAELLESTATNA